MALENFADILMSLRRQKAAASGRSPTQQEVAGLTEGYASSAESRLADEKSLALTERMHEETLAEQKSEFEQSLTKSASEFEKTYGLEKSEFEQSLTKSASEFEKTYALEKAEAEESASQFAQTLATSKEQYQQTYEESKSEYEQTLAESISQHDDSMALSWAEYKEDLRQFNASLSESARQFELSLAQSQSQFASTMAYNYEDMYAQIDAANKANRTSQTTNTLTGILGGAYVGAQIGGTIYPVVGAVVGAVIGAAVSSISWLCTETNKQVGLDIEMLQSIGRFRSYAWDNHKRIFVYYMRTGPRLIENINKKLGQGARKIFEDFKDSILYPVMVATDSCQMEDAFQLYKNKSLELIKEYLPEQIEKLEGLIVKDDIRFLNLAV